MTKKLTFDNFTDDFLIKTKFDSSYMSSIHDRQNSGGAVKNMAQFECDFLAYLCNRTIENVKLKL